MQAIIKSKSNINASQEQQNQELNNEDQQSIQDPDLETTLQKLAESDKDLVHVENIHLQEENKSLLKQVEQLKTDLQ